MSDPKIIDLWTTKNGQQHRLLEIGDDFGFEFTEDGAWVRAELVDMSQFLPGIQMVAVHPSIMSALACRIEQLCAEKREVN